MRQDPIEIRGRRRPGGLPRRQPIYLGLVTWQQAAFLAAIATAVVSLLRDRDQHDYNRARQTLVGHSGTVKSVVFRPDGKMLCSIGFDGSFMLWDLATSQEYTFLTRELGPLRCAAFSPDSKLVATASAAGTVAIHDFDTHESRILYNRTTDSCGTTSLAFAPHDATLAIGLEDGQIGLWEVAAGRCRKILNGHTKFVASMAFSPDGTCLASSSGDHLVRLWDLPAGGDGFVIGDRVNTAAIIAFSPDGRLLLLGNQVSSVIRFCELTTGCKRSVQAGLAGSLMAVAISSDGATLATANYHGLVMFWDLPTLTVEPRRLTHAGVHSLAFAPDSHTLATGGFDGTIQIWDCAPPH